jgi:hypothetical protein
VPSQDRGLLARLDALVALVADRHGLTLLPDSRLSRRALVGLWSRTLQSLFHKALNWAFDPNGCAQHGGC